MQAIIETILSRGFIEFSHQGRTYLIQAESNKGWDYLSLWRTAPGPTCLHRVFFDGPDGISEEAIRELLDRPFSDEHTIREILQSPETTLCPSSKRNGCQRVDKVLSPR